MKIEKINTKCYAVSNVYPVKNNQTVTIKAPNGSNQPAGANLSAINNQMSGIFAAPALNNQAINSSIAPVLCNQTSSTNIAPALNNQAANTGMTPVISNQAPNAGITPSKNNQTVKKVLIAGGILACAAGVTALAVIKGKKGAPSKIYDLDYKEKLVSALEKEGIKVKAKDLKSVVGPEEFSDMIGKYEPSHFQAGIQSANCDMPLEEFFKNSINGDFRISAHTHSNYSDGKATVEEFLDCAKKYAGKVEKMNKNDGLPPFTIALTDHDTVDGCKEAVKLIAKNPEKYKNLKFIPGCEFSVRNGSKCHDVTGLALNPFDEKLNNMLGGLKADRRKSVMEFLDEKNKLYGKKITLEELAEYEKRHYINKGKDGKRSIENGSGIVSVRHAVKYFYKMTGNERNTAEMNALGNKNILNIETVVDTINESGGLASLTHPIKSFWSYIGDDELLRLKKMGIKGIEVNHQYTPSKIRELGEKNGDYKNADKIFKELTEKYKNFAVKNGMFMSGGTDCHEKQIFTREPKMSLDFLETKLLN